MLNTEVYWENVKKLLPKNYIATICEITKQTFSNSVDSKLLNPTPGPILGTQFKIEIEYAMK